MPSVPRLAGPPVSDSAKLLGVLARVAVAQAGRGVADRFRQFRRGVDADWQGVDRDGLDVDVTEYEGPAGRGYQIDVETVDGATRWRRIVSVGPESQRETAWVEVPAA